MMMISSIELTPFSQKALIAFTAVVAQLYIYNWTSSYQRRRRIPCNEERVLVIGGSSGVGRSLAQQYAKRGAHVCVTGRRLRELEKVKAECLALRPSEASPTHGEPVLIIPADFTNAEDMIHLRDVLSNTWGGVDTVAVCAGVSALRPLLDIAGMEGKDGVQVTQEGIQKTIDVSNAAIRGNYTGPLVSAVALIPLLKSTSVSPSILLVSSVAAIVPAPTRSLYCSTKSASLSLYQSLSIEHPEIAFSYVMPSTIEGDFRASAVDGGPVREASPNKHGLKREYVAQRCIRAVDAGTRNIYLPWWFGRLGHLAYWTIPSVAEWVASKKYRYP